MQPWFTKIFACFWIRRCCTISEDLKQHSLPYNSENMDCWKNSGQDLRRIFNICQYRRLKEKITHFLLILLFMWCLSDPLCLFCSYGQLTVFVFVHTVLDEQIDIIEFVCVCVQLRVNVRAVEIGQLTLIEYWQTENAMLVCVGRCVYVWISFLRGQLLDETQQPPISCDLFLSIFLSLFHTHTSLSEAFWRLIN